MFACVCMFVRVSILSVNLITLFFHPLNLLQFNSNHSEANHKNILNTQIRWLENILMALAVGVHLIYVCFIKDDESVYMDLVSTCSL